MMLPFELIWFVGIVVVASGSIVQRLRRGRRWATAMDRLLDPTLDLGPLASDVHARLTMHVRSAWAWKARGETAQYEQALDEISACLAVLYAECGRLDEARAILGDSTRAVVRLARARVDLAAGRHADVSDSVVNASDDIGPLPPIVRTDTRAQLELARGFPEVALSRISLPLTRARILAVLGHDADASAILRKVHVSRIDAMCRLYPDEPATRLAVHLRENVAPYR